MSSLIQGDPQAETNHTRTPSQNWNRVEGFNHALDWEKLQRWGGESLRYRLEYEWRSKKHKLTLSYHQLTLLCRSMIANARMNREHLAIDTCLKLYSKPLKD